MIGALSSIVCPLVTSVFLVCGFVYNQQQINRIVFPVKGILLRGVQRRPFAAKGDIAHVRARQIDVNMKAFIPLK